jgi:uncharacterized protein (TIGR03000 family)
MNRRIALVASAVGIANWIAFGFATTTAAEEKPIQIIVWLPAGSELEMAGQRMAGKGDVRGFQSPPLDVGKEFTYTFKATWKEADKPRVIETTVNVRAGATIEVDLYPDNELLEDEKAVCWTW